MELTWFVVVACRHIFCLRTQDLHDMPRYGERGLEVCQKMNIKSKKIPGQKIED